MNVLKPTILSMALALVAGPALAEYVPRSGPNDNRVRVATYQDGQVYRLSDGLQNRRSRVRTLMPLPRPISSF